jgi:glycosyltransferase involved in cell wall biosynthesis
MAHATVSVVIPAHNAGATLNRALASALNQNYSDLDVIVVDDGSTDDTPAVAAACGTRVLRQPNRGPAAARNRGVSVSRAKYVAFLDADDEWLPGRLARTVEALERAPGASLSYCDVFAILESGEPIRTAEGFEPRSAPSMEDLCTRWWPILTSAVSMQRETFERTGGFDESFASPGYEDALLWLRARELGEFRRVPEQLVRYRIDPLVERMEKYRGGYRTFARAVRRRYGARARPLIRNTRDAVVAVQGFEGLMALRRDDVVAARRHFIRALSYRPFYLRQIGRLARTFLPRRLAVALSGRTRFIVPGTDDQAATLNTGLASERAQALPVRTVR